MQTTGVDSLGVVHSYRPGALTSYGIRWWGTHCGGWAGEPKTAGEHGVVTCMTCLVKEAGFTR